MCENFFLNELMVKCYKTAHRAEFDLPTSPSSIAAFGGPTSLETTLLKNSPRCQAIPH